LLIRSLRLFAYPRELALDEMLVWRNHRNLALLAFNFLRKDVLRNELSLLKTDSAYNHGTDGKVATQFYQTALPPNKLIIL
jgi:hypothetical protein